jgi:transglutaminase-like putative cysteine protease
MAPSDNEYLLPALSIDSDHAAIIDYALDTVRDVGKDPLAQAVKLYYAVRDGIRYDPYAVSHLPEHYRASTVLKDGRGFCVQKATLLCALGRVCRIPSRVGFATVRNHLATTQLIEFVGSDVFVFHGFTEFYLEGKWVKATPAFSNAICRIHNVKPLDFNGRDDSVFQAYDLSQKKFMEYVEHHGTYADIPIDTMIQAWEEFYGEDRVRFWFKEFEKSGGKGKRDFASEEIWKGD